MLPPEGYRRVEGPPGRIWILHDGLRLSSGAPEWDLWVAGQAGVPAAEAGGRGSAWIVSVPGTGEVIVRRCLHGGLLAGIRRDRFPGMGRALKELEVSEALRSRGVATPEILALHFRRDRAGLWRGILVTRRIPASRNLREWLLREGRDRSRWLPVLGETARAVAALHGAGGLHNDLNLSNLLLTPSGVVVLDLDGARLRKLLTVSERGSNLLRLFRSLRKEAGRRHPLGPLEAHLFLRRYASGDRTLLRELVSWLRRWGWITLLHPMRRRRAALPL